MKLHPTTIIFTLATLLRLVLIIYADWQDEHLIVKYTDIDYVVFTDAARAVHGGQSPYTRSTYRYTPLLAWLLVPNITVFRAFGKLLFAAADLGVGVLLSKLLRLADPRPRSPYLHAACVASWLLNPIVFTISTRGSADVLVSALVLFTLYLVFRKQPLAAGVVLGVAVHVKLYPIIYAPSIVLALSNRYRPTRATMRFIIGAATSFAVLFLLCYLLYGADFVQHTYLYHLSRRDHRHNFSVFYYAIYMGMDDTSIALSSLSLSLPQVLLVAACAFLLAPDNLVLACFAQTFVFVAWNKVITAQYFVWYWSLLPLLLPYTALSWTKLAGLFALWLGAELHWLYHAYLLEFEGVNSHLSIWIASLFFLFTHTLITSQLLRHHHSNHPPSPWYKLTQTLQTTTSKSL